MSLFTRVKICGITTASAALQAAQAGADALGLNFYPASPRYLADLQLAREIALAAGPFVTVVGLFVDPEPHEVQRVLEEVPLGLLQFHGEEDDAFCTQFHRPYIKALRMKPNWDVNQAFSAYPNTSGLLLDAYCAQRPGGTGETFDWARVPKKAPKPIVLAGGLTPVNVAQAIAQVQPWAVDVSGGVESQQGIKDPTLVTQFIERAKGT